MNKKIIIITSTIILFLGFVSFLSLSYLLPKNKQKALSLNQEIGEVLSMNRPTENKSVLAQGEEINNLKIDQKVKSTVGDNEEVGIEQGARTESGMGGNGALLKQANDNNNSPQSDQDKIIPPNPPAGFIWQRLEEINGLVLKPNSWHFKHEKKNTTEAYFVTKEEIIGENGFFDTGLSMNIVPSSGIPGGDAYKYGRGLAESYKENGSVEFFNEEEFGVFSIFMIRGTFQDAGVTFKMSVEILANRKTNTLYLITFESSLNEWDLEWKTGVQILNNMMIDDEI